MRQAIRDPDQLSRALGALPELGLIALGGGGIGRGFGREGGGESGPLRVAPEKAGKRRESPPSHKRWRECFSLWRGREAKESATREMCVRLECDLGSTPIARHGRAAHTRQARALRLGKICAATDATGRGQLKG